MAGPTADPEGWARWEAAAGIVRTRHLTPCTRAWGLAISALDQHPLRCSDGAALNSFALEKCVDGDGAGAMQPVTKGRSTLPWRHGTHRFSYTCIRAEADGRQDWRGGGTSAAPTPLPPSQAETMCAAAMGRACEHLQAHPLSCAATHVLAALHFNREGCATPKTMHFSFGCVPLPAATQQYEHLADLDKASLGA
tara:strand:- start:25 stop:609 length:585 start_codon:yes stop_codon:yes gene_type:complete